MSWLLSYSQLLLSSLFSPPPQHKYNKITLIASWLGIIVPLWELTQGSRGRKLVFYSFLLFIGSTPAAISSPPLGWQVGTAGRDTSSNVLASVLMWGAIKEFVRLRLSALHQWRTPTLAIQYSVICIVSSRLVYTTSVHKYMKRHIRKWREYFRAVRNRINQWSICNWWRR
jgi:hypothetical protein